MKMWGKSSSNSSLHLPPDMCFSRKNIFAFTSLFLTYIFFLPLFILTVNTGYQRWRKQRPVATAAIFSHSDVFTFHAVFMDVIGFWGFLISALGTYTGRMSLVDVGINILCLISSGETLFHLLTCVERYLAVVHPITYVGLKQSGGVRLRNVSIGCVWLLSFASLGLLLVDYRSYVIYDLLLLAFVSTVVSFCSVSVLCVLIRPGPGDLGGNRERVDQSKQRAFYTIVAILGALLLRFLSNKMSHLFIALFDHIWYIDYCLMIWSTTWFCLPSSLVLPLLFLHRAGKLPDCKHNAEPA